jgi:dihydrofolate synthase/folylpolyglutamate synthase
VREAQSGDLEAYWRAHNALLRLIRGERHATRTPAARRCRAEAKLQRTHDLLSALGEPQTRFRAVHVTGTSGKGSTAAATAAMLTAAGYRVGLRTSPYLQVATEKLQIDGKLIDARSFERVTSRVLEVAAKRFPADRPGQRIGYGEVWSALAFLWFAEQEIDIAVVEVGAGGRFDATNVIDADVSVITSVGLDHLVTLGPTLADIAWHKAGIIKPGSTVVVGAMPDEAAPVIAAEARKQRAKFIDATVLPFPNAPLGMNGDFQSTNARIAVSAIAALRERGFTIPEDAIPLGLANARLPGRLERMPGGRAPDVWIDGAHNPDKVAALAREVCRLFTNCAPVIVLGVLGAKDVDAIARGIIPAASTIICTEPSVVGKRALAAHDLKQALVSAGFTGELLVEPAPDRALHRAKERARQTGANVLVTGSMYLSGQVRRCWYPDDAIVLQRTPWPAVAPPGGDQAR